MSQSHALQHFMGMMEGEFREHKPIIPKERQAGLGVCDFPEKHQLR